LPSRSEPDWCAVAGPDCRLPREDIEITTAATRLGRLNEMRVRPDRSFMWS
jgi:hypothetical protein